MILQRPLQLQGRMRGQTFVLSFWLSSWCVSLLSSFPEVLKLFHMFDVSSKNGRFIFFLFDRDLDAGTDRVEVVMSAH